VKTPLLPLSAAILALASTAAFAQTPALAPGDIFLSEDFDSTPVGQIPKGFASKGAVAVAEDTAHSGKHSLKMSPAEKGARVITLNQAEANALGGEHWGRLYYKMKLPTPLPVPPPGKTTGGIHSTIVSGNAVSPAATGDKIEVRLAGTSTNMTGAFKYLYNVQPRGGRKEFGVSAKETSQYSDQWTLIEWHADYATQTYQFFVNGKEIPELSLHKGAGNFDGIEIPKNFDDLAIGWLNYQSASGEGFTVWIDDLVLAKKQIGAGPVPETAGIRK
jgi:hypothetical protein